MPIDKKNWPKIGEIGVLIDGRKTDSPLEETEHGLLTAQVNGEVHEWYPSGGDPRFLNNLSHSIRVIPTPIEFWINTHTTEGLLKGFERGRYPNLAQAKAAAPTDKISYAHRIEVNVRESIMNPEPV